MRVGDLTLTLVPLQGDTLLEQADGQVLARPGTVYSLRFQNHAPLRAVVDVLIDGASVSGSGLVLPASGTATLERPIHDTERGRFTVFAEGNEAVFGESGGRDNEALGLIEVRYRRELPRPQVTFIPVVQQPAPYWPYPQRPYWEPYRSPRGPWLGDMFVGAVQTGQPSLLRAAAGGASASYATNEMDAASVAVPILNNSGDQAARVERAAGTGLTGASDQRFSSVSMGPLETEVTVLRLRLVIGSVEAMNAPRPLPRSEGPARPAARP